MRTSDKLLIIFWRASPSDFLPNVETSFDRTREILDTSCSSVADRSRQTGGPFLRNGVGIVHFAEDSRLSSTVQSLMEIAPKGYNLHLQQQ